MTYRHLIIIAVLLAWAIFIIGCPGEESQSVNAVEHVVAKVNVAAVEPVAIETVAAEPVAVEPVAAEPITIAIAVVESSVPDVNIVEGEVVEPNEPEIIIAEVNIPEPNEVEVEATEPVATEASESEVSGKVGFHNKCAYILTNFVDEKGMVDYRTLRRKRLELKRLLREFDELDPKEYKGWPKDERVAFWINAYNMQLVNIILKNYPIKSTRWGRLVFGPKSIRNIEGDFEGIWNNKKFIVMDEEFTLSEIERRLFDKEFDDPRVFFALSRASVSGPPLRNEPYSGQKLGEQLEDQARKFLANPLAFKIDRGKKKVYLWALFDPKWLGDKFVEKYGIDKKFKDQPEATRAVLNFITKYVTEEDVSYLEVGNYSIGYMKYNWKLNE